MRLVPASAMGVWLAACGGSSTPPEGSIPNGTPTPAPAVLISLHLAGDSTMGVGLPERRPETGWGECLQDRFDSERVRVVNHAQRGRSTRTFRSEGFWDSLLAKTSAGDYVLIQFGHNDGSRDEEETPPAEYRANLTRFVSEARARGAFPVLATPIVVRTFDRNGVLQDRHGPYPDYLRAVALVSGTPLLDMQQVSAQIVTAYGPERSKELFQHLSPGQHPNYPNGLSDDIHLSPQGACEIARGAAPALRGLNLPLSRFLK